MFIQCLLCDRYGGRNSPGAACLLGTWTSIRTSLRDTHRIAGLAQDRSEVYPGCHLPHVGPSLSLLILLSLEKLLPTLVDSNSPSPGTSVSSPISTPPSTFQRGLRAASSWLQGAWLRGIASLCCASSSPRLPGL